MSEDPQQEELVQRPETPWPTALPATGDAAVDRVLADVGELPERTAAKQAAFFERAHEQLTAALDAKPGPTPQDRHA